MNYEELIKTVSEVHVNEKIYKGGLTLVYILNDKNYKQMNEELFYKSNPLSTPFVPAENEFEAEVGGIVVRFIKEISIV